MRHKHKDWYEVDNAWQKDFISPWDRLRQDYEQRNLDQEIEDDKGEQVVYNLVRLLFALTRM